MEQKDHRPLEEDQISQVPFFGQFAYNPVMLRSILSRCTRKTFPTSSVIFDQGSPVDGVYILQQGEVETSSITNQIPNPKCVSSRRGDLFGQLDMSAGNQKATLRSKTDATLIFVPAQVFKTVSSKQSNQRVLDSNASVFAHMTTSALQHLHHNSTRKTYGIRDVVYSAGSGSLNVYVVVAGEFGVLEHKHSMYKFTTNSFFGFQDSNGAIRENTVVCCSAQGVLVEYKKQQFDTHCLSNPEVLKYLKSIAEQRRVKCSKPLEVGSTGQSFPAVECSSGQAQMTEQWKSVIGSNKVFKRVDREYKMINSIRKHEKRPNSRNNLVPQPWFKTSDKKTKTRIEQMERKAGLTRGKQNSRANNGHHSVVRSLLLQLNYDPNLPYKSLQTNRCLYR